MKIYRVGGSVRDELMGIEPKDHDFLVTGSSFQEMLSLGFKQVGKSFPVFLHPETGDEYALARRERSTGPGHSDFAVEFTPDVTVEEDLRRRDLTINSIALDLETGEYIDPYGGREDIKNKILRHTSDAFAEDPLRPLRVARFLARFGPSWTVAPELMSVIGAMSHTASDLQLDRVHQEAKRAFTEKYPYMFTDFIIAHFVAFDRYIMSYAHFRNEILVDPDKSYRAKCFVLHQMFTTIKIEDFEPYYYIAGQLLQSANYDISRMTLFVMHRYYQRIKNATPVEIKSNLLGMLISKVHTMASRYINVLIEYDRVLTSTDTSKKLTEMALHGASADTYRMFKEDILSRILISFGLQKSVPGYGY